MIKLIHDATLPLVALRTRDTINIEDVLKHLTGGPVWKFKMDAPTIGKNKVYYLIFPKAMPGEKIVVNWQKAYIQLVESESTLFVINPPQVDDLMFDGGEVPVPHKMVTDFLFKITEDKGKAEVLSRALGGLTIKESAEIIRLTMARDSALNAKGIVSTRQQIFPGMKGLSFVDTYQDIYVPNPELEAWVLSEKSFFLGEVDHRLRPRGVLFDGPPGVGKTAGAKYIANQWGVSLFHMDLGATKGKYVGESEGQLKANLSKLDHEQPCVVLFDEMEKMSPSAEAYDSGTSSGMQSAILWWLAEHRSKVLAVMTTNKRDRLPPELYRQGRVDRVFQFGGLDGQGAFDLAHSIIGTFTKEAPDDEALSSLVNSLLEHQGLPTNPPTVAHSTVTTAVYTAIKAGSIKV